MILVIDDEFWSWGADSHGVPCFVTGEKTHYFHGFKDESGNVVYVDALLGDRILEGLRARSVWENHLPLLFESPSIEVRDNRVYRTFFNPSLEPDYEPTYLDDPWHWVAAVPTRWVPAEENDLGIESIALQMDPSMPIPMTNIVGYNGITKGDAVIYHEEKYTVVMISRMGDFGLSKTGKLPYEMRVFPSQVEKIA